MKGYRAFFNSRKFPNSTKLHLVGEFPSPKFEGFAHCGKGLVNLTELKGVDLRELDQNLICEKCRVLSGYVK